MHHPPGSVQETDLSFNGWNMWVWLQNFRVSKALTSYDISSIINFIDKFAHCFVIVLYFKDFRGAAILWWLRHVWALQPNLVWEGLTKATPFTWTITVPTVSITVFIEPVRTKWFCLAIIITFKDRVELFFIFPNKGEFPSINITSFLQRKD